MKALVVILCLAGSGALWYWALATPKPADPLDAEYSGTFELFRYESAPGQTGDDPAGRGEKWVFVIGTDHIYTIHVSVAGDFELAQRSGVATSETTPDGREFLVLTQHTQDFTPMPLDPERYFAEWGSDDNGRYLHLTRELADGRGPQLFLRPAQK